MKTPFLTFALLLSIAAVFAQGVKPGTTPVKKWETGPGLKIPESVMYDATTGVIYVSNIDGNPGEKDGKGSIGTIAPDGKILNPEWVKGIDAPKGMGILNKHLFVTNIDELVEIDIATATIVNRYKAEGSQFLNDIAADPNSGRIFITDSGTGQVYILLNGKISLWLKGPTYKGANGLFLKDNILYIGAGNSILQTDLKNDKVTVSVPNTGGVDGLFVTSDGKFIFSDWAGSLFMAELNKKPELLLNTSDQKVNAADFGIIAEKHLILIPTFFDNRVMCYTSSVIH
jgi:DNA-binding beta-propeller fold protein YncE